MSISDWGMLSFCFLAVSCVGYYLPISLHRLYESSDDKTYFHQLVALTILYGLQYLFRVLYQTHMAFLSRKIIQSIRIDVFTKWLFDRSSWSGTSQIDKYSVGEIQARILSDTNSLKEAVDNGSLTILFDFILVAASLVSFVTINLKVGAMFLAIQTLLIIGLLFTSSKMAYVFHNVRKSYALMTRELTDILKGLHQIFGIQQKNYAISRMLGPQNQYLQSQLKSNLFDASYFSVAESLFPLFIATLVAIVPITLGKNLALLAVIIDLIQRSVGPLKDLANKISSLQRVFAGIDRVQEFESDLQPIYLRNRAKVGDQDIKAVEIQVPEFSYQASGNRSFFLEAMNIKLERGQSLGIAGRSGSGKSTLLKLVALQLYCPQLKINLHDELTTRQLSFSLEEDLSYWAQRISLISQDSHLFTTSLYFNLSLSHEWNDEFSIFWDKMKTLIPYLSIWNINPKDRLIPLELSFGQKQLISALRAMYLKRPIILFDEISAGMDTLLESSLYQVLQLIMRDSLTFIVAHRLETIKRCDRILLIEDGKILGEGAHGELLSACAKYAQYMKEAELE